MTRWTSIAVAALPLTIQAFAPMVPHHQHGVQVAKNGKTSWIPSTLLFAEGDDKKASESIFIGLDEEDIDEEVTFAKAESLGRGAAKVCVYVEKHYYHVNMYF